MKDSLSKDFWEKFSFSGDVTYSETYLDEDMSEKEMSDFIESHTSLFTNLVYISEK